MNFLLKLLINIQDSAHINQINNENSDWSITLNSNGIPVSCKIDTGAQCNVFPLTILKKFDPEPSFCHIYPHIIISYPHIITLKFADLENVHLL